MSSDEHGMPVPCDPKQDASAFFAYRDHAAKWQVECREIVRRLSVWYDEAGTPGGSVSFNVIEVSRDAASLWAKMWEEAKGGDGG